MYVCEFIFEDVGGDFDYVIEAPQGCRQNEAIVRFGDGSKPITQLSVAFWARYTQKAGLGTIMNIYGSVGGYVIILIHDFLSKQH